MKKTYTVLSVTHTQISSEKGSMTWCLNDNDENLERRVTAVTTLDKQGYIESARPVYIRETPLTERLMQQLEGDTFSIDFGSFNEAMGYIKRDVYNDIVKFERISQFSKHLNKILTAATVLIMCWLGWLTVDSFTEFSEARNSNNYHELP